MSAPLDRSEHHPLDRALGVIHEIALILAAHSDYATAQRLAAAHEAIQQYLIAEPETPVREASAPGQWDADLVNAYIRDQEGRIVADVTRDGFSDEDFVAHCRLIAAAPDLLAACKAKLAACEDCKDAALMPGEVCSNECAAMADAVEKAEGRI